MELTWVLRDLLTFVRLPEGQGTDLSQCAHAGTNAAYGRKTVFDPRQSRKQMHSQKKQTPPKRGL